MLNFKEWLLAEEFTSLLTPGKDVITLGQPVPPELSGFCLHNPEINKFALKNSTQMFIVFAFVLYTIQKEWQIVHHTFPNFMKWVFTEAIHKDNWEYGDQPFSIYGHLMGGGGNQSKTSAPYLRELWLNKERIFDNIKNLYAGSTATSSLSDSADYKIFKYIFNNIKGLGIVKSAFACQLIIGKFGCIDSVNMRAYRNIIDADIDTKQDKSSFKRTPREGKRGIVTDKEGNPVFDYKVKDSGRGFVGYNEFLQALEALYGQNISQTLWNDWCRIVGQKVVKAGTGDKITLQVNKDIVVINPYKPKSHIRGLLDAEKENLAQFEDPGLGISLGHLNAIKRGAEHMPESFIEWLLLKEQAGSGFAYVGNAIIIPSAHGDKSSGTTKIAPPSDNIAKEYAKNICEKYGYWYEGTGEEDQSGDGPEKSYCEKVLGVQNPKNNGSYDDNVEMPGFHAGVPVFSSVKANWKTNSPKIDFQNSNTIGDALRSALANGAGTFANHGVNKKLSDSEIEEIFAVVEQVFPGFRNQQFTKDKAAEFYEWLLQAENKMWEEKGNALSNLGDVAEKNREDQIVPFAQTKGGLLFLGADHFPRLKGVQWTPPQTAGMNQQKVSTSPQMQAQPQMQQKPQPQVAQQS